MKRDEYEEAIVAAQKDLVHWCNEANFIEIDGFVATSAHYLIELSKRWDFDRDQARHLAHGRQGKRITIEEATAHSIKATKRHFREKTYKEWSEKYAPIPATKDPAPEPPREVQEAPPPPKSPRKRRRKRGPRKPSTYPQTTGEAPLESAETLRPQTSQPRPSLEPKSQTGNPYKNPSRPSLDPHSSTRQQPEAAGRDTSPEQHDPARESESSPLDRSDASGSSSPHPRPAGPRDPRGRHTAQR